MLAAEGEHPSALQYTGEHWNGDVGLLYLRARWYDPATGRFLSQDPFPGFAALPQTQHGYVYVGNNPINLTNPSGEIAPLLIAMGVGAATGTVIGAAGGAVSYVLAHPGGRPEDYLHDRGFWRSTGVGAASGFVAGAVTGAVWPFLAPATGTLVGSMVVSAELWALGGAAGRITANLLTPCVSWYDGVPETVAINIVLGMVTGGVGYGVRYWLANRIAPITPSNSPGGLRRAMGSSPQGMQNPQRHHNLPWKFRNWFAGPRRGLNVNSSSFGRWVEGAPPGQHQNWSYAYNEAWGAFIQQNPTADRWLVKAFLRLLLLTGRFP